MQKADLQGLTQRKEASGKRTGSAKEGLGEGRGGWGGRDPLFNLNMFTDVSLSRDNRGWRACEPNGSQVWQGNILCVKPAVFHALKLLLRSKILWADRALELSSRRLPVWLSCTNKIELQPMRGRLNQVPVLAFLIGLVQLLCAFDVKCPGVFAFLGPQIAAHPLAETLWEPFALQMLV